MLLEAYHRQQLGLNQKATGNGIIAWCVVMTTWCLQRPGWLRDVWCMSNMKSWRVKRPPLKILNTCLENHIRLLQLQLRPIFPSNSLPQPNCAGHVTPEIDNPYPGPFFLWFGVGTIAFKTFAIATWMRWEMPPKGSNWRTLSNASFLHRAPGCGKVKVLVLPWGSWIVQTLCIFVCCCQSAALPCLAHSQCCGILQGRQARRPASVLRRSPTWFYIVTY